MRPTTVHSFKQPTSVSRGGNNFAFTYGASLERLKETRNGTTTYEIDKLYEEESSGNWRIYLQDIAIIKYHSNNGHQIRYTHKDRLGSTLTYSDHDGQVTDRRMFDAFGKPRAVDGNNLLPARLQNLNLSRNGFTDHRHLDEVELIHMNGRAYDYNLGRFLSVDPIIQSPGNSQSLNPYSYIMNNPLAGTDPTGYMGCAASKINSVCERSDANHGGFGGAGSSGKVSASITQEGSTAKIHLTGGNGASQQAVVNALQQGMNTTDLMAQGANSQQALTDGQKSQIYSDTLSTIGSGAKAAIGNLIPDTVNGIAGWTEQFLHKDEGSLGRLDQWVGVENEVVQEVANDLRKVGAIATANIPLLRAGVSTPNSPIASSGGVIRQFEQVGDKVYFRVFSGDSQMGARLTAAPPRSSAWAMEALALPRHNRATMIQEVLVPHGTLLERSRAIPMPQWGRMRGGAEQFRLIDEIPRQNFGPGVPFK